MRIQSSLLAITLLAGLVFSSSLLAQQSGGGNTGGGTTGGGTTGGGTTGGTTGGNTGGNTGNIPGNTGNRNPSQFPTDQNRFPEMDRFENRPIFLSGKVITEDGTPPPEPATIERICAGVGSPIQEAYTDSKGRFSFQVGQRMGMLPDASIGNSADVFSGRAPSSSLGGFGGNQPRVSERELSMCELRASLPGYRSSTISLAGRRSLDNPEVGTIFLRRLADVSGFTTSATSLLAPKDAKKALEKAQGAMKKAKWADAQKQLELALSLHPKYAEAHYKLGFVYLQTKNIDGARAAYEKAIEADPKYISPYLGIAQLDAHNQKWDQVKATADKILALNRYDFPHAYFYGAVASFNLQDSVRAEELCRKGIEMDQFHSIPKMSHLLGMILANKQDYQGASAQLASYLKFAPKAADADQVRKQLADIEGRVAQLKTPQP
ncbi:MAG: hypothetical protein OHK0021_04190 [Bryobacter sp.]